MDLVVSSLAAPAATARGIEMVERKGRGHPDTICDALAEELSVALCREYLEKAGLILHHNVDKALLVGGVSRPAFQGGEVIEPIEIILAGRATRQIGSVHVPVDEIAWTAAERWLRRSLHALDPARHVRIHPRIRPGSQDLVDLFLRQRHAGSWLANDTSCGVGHAPRTPLERSVRAVSDRLAEAAEREGRVEVGEDVKVMGVRHGHHVRLTVACAFVGRHLDDVDSYLAAKARVKRMAEEAAASVPGGEGTVDVNMGDDPRHGAVYLTVTGTSAEGGDDGQVGRGNRSCGLITPFAPMSLEAAAGKNPVTHVGKLYNLAASRIAGAVVATVPGVESAQCFLVSQIGRPITDPQAAEVHVSLQPGQHVALVRPRIQEIVREHVSRVDTLWQDVLAGEAPAY